MKNSKRHIAATVVSTAAVTVLAVVPALAGPKDLEGMDRGTPMELWQAILVFGVGPLVISGLLSLIVLVPDWAKRARLSTRGGYLDDPTLADRLPSDSATHAQLGH